MPCRQETASQTARSQHLESHPPSRTGSFAPAKTRTICRYALLVSMSADLRLRLDGQTTETQRKHPHVLFPPLTAGISTIIVMRPLWTLVNDAAEQHRKPQAAQKNSYGEWRGSTKRCGFLCLQLELSCEVFSSLRSCCILPRQVQLHLHWQSAIKAIEPRQRSSALISLG